MWRRNELWDVFSCGRLDWTAILTHPFWAGKLSHLVRPQTGAAKKSVNQSQTQGESLSSLGFSYDDWLRTTFQIVRKCPRVWQPLIDLNPMSHSASGKQQHLRGQRTLKRRWIVVRKHLFKSLNITKPMMWMDTKLQRMIIHRSTHTNNRHRSARKVSNDHAGCSSPKLNCDQRPSWKTRRFRRPCHWSSKANYYRSN